ncbi:MAG: coproporphyrinogen dehydrogenase HemZ [Phascolarctobacterium sp.]
MSTYFSLRNLCGFEITRPVCDMAAFFDYELALAPEQVDTHLALLTVSYDSEAHLVSAFLNNTDQSCSSTQQCQLEQGSEPTGGELTRCVKLAVVDVLAQATGEKPAMPWGILTGVRPGKLAHKLLDSGKAASELSDYIQKAYLLPQEQGSMLTTIAVKQKQILPDSTRFTDAGIYIGVPYCPSRCSYCSFPAGIVPQDEESQQNFVNLIEQDVQNVVQLLGMHSLSIKSLYIGGGTPTSLNDKVFARLLEVVGQYLHFPSVQEFTVEAGRPDCFSKAKLAAMEAAGVDRISVNPQSFHDKTLQLIGRKHTVDDFYRAYAEVRQSSIPIVNVDLIIGLPGENAEEISYSLKKAVELAPENLTIHTLTLKRSAALFGSKIQLPAEQAAELVEQGRQLAGAIGLEPYYLYRQHYMLGHLANIGYAKAGTESIYNIQMMEERHPVIGVGPSSSTKLPLADGHHLRRMNMPKNVAVYASGLSEFCLRREELFR